MKVSLALLHFLPGSSFAISGGDYSTLEWDQGNEHPKPTEQEFNQYVAQFAAIEAQRKKIQELNQLFEQTMRDLVKGEYPEDEINSWPEQVYEARQYSQNPAASVPLLTAIAANRNLTLQDQVDRVLQKAAAYATAAGSLVGKRHKIQEEIESGLVEDVKAAWNS